MRSIPHRPHRLADHRLPDVYCLGIVLGASAALWAILITVAMYLTG
jgi:hypothetical protein